MSEQGLIQAERRVREMNRVTRQYTDQGNRFMQQIQQVQNMRNNQTRFEQVVPNNNTYNSGNNVPQNPQMQKMQNGGRRQQNMQTVQSAQTVQNTQNVQNRQTVRSEADGCSAAAKNYPAGNTQAWNGAAGMLPLLSDLNLDGEKLMIILIMYLLIKEKADIKLILALGYLLL